jgi:hypothetical protein
MSQVVFAAFLAIGDLLARLGQAPLLRYVHLRACVIVAVTLATTLAAELYTAKGVFGPTVLAGAAARTRGCNH